VLLTGVDYEGSLGRTRANRRAAVLDGVGTQVIRNMALRNVVLNRIGFSNLLKVGDWAKGPCAAHTGAARQREINNFQH
jgi:hypothetical protein